MPPRNSIDRKRVQQLLAQGVRPVDIARRLGCSKNGLATAMAQMRKEGVIA